MNDIWILAIVGGIALIFLVVFGGGLFHSGSASGQAGSGGSGLLSTGGAGGATVTPSFTSNPLTKGAQTTSSSTFGYVSGSSVYLGNVTGGQGGVTIYEPYVYAPTSSEQTYTSSSYAPTQSVTNPTQVTPTQNAPNTGIGGGISGGGGGGGLSWLLPAPLGGAMPLFP